MVDADLLDKQLQPNNLGGLRDVLHPFRKVLGVNLVETHVHGKNPQIHSRRQVEEFFKLHSQLDAVVGHRNVQLLNVSDDRLNGLHDTHQPFALYGVVPEVQFEGFKSEVFCQGICHDLCFFFSQPTHLEI